MPELISSHGNPVARLIRSLRQKRGRDETGLFLVEGVHHAGEAVQAGWDVESLVYSPEQLTSDFAIHLIQEQSQAGTKCVAMTSDLFTDLAEKENPQGILAIVRQRHLDLKAAPVRKIKFAAAVVSPQDPGNVGTILRTLDAVGGDGLFLLDGGVELYHPSAVRASMGTLFWKPVIQAAFKDFTSWARENQVRLIGSSAHAQVDYGDLQRDARPVILLLGSEQKGLSAEQLGCCELAVSLPMKGRASSLNLAVAAGILLYKLMN